MLWRLGPCLCGSLRCRFSHRVFTADDADFFSYPRNPRYPRFNALGRCYSEIVDMECAGLGLRQFEYALHASCRARSFIELFDGLRKSWTELGN